MRGYALILLALVGCASDAAIPPPHDRALEPTSPSNPRAANGSPANALAASARPRLQWKRYAALEADLASALEMPAAALCDEFGKEPCIRGVHLVPLGGYDPFVSGMLEPAAEPLATTPTVVERIVLSACSRRVALERSAPALFPFDLASAPSADSIDALATSLYRRFMARDPEPLERTTLLELAHDEAGNALRGDELATLACFLVGTSSEFLFF